MKRVLSTAGLILLTAIALVGCRTAPEEEPPPPSNGGEIEIRLAPIEEVRVNIAESFPPQYFIYIRAGLSDGCTTPHEVKTERISTTDINITVTTQRPRDAICTQVYGTFERNVALGSDFASGTTYRVSVNGAKSVTFVAQ